MPNGFQTFRAGGAADLNTSTITSRIIGIVTYTSAGVSAFDVPVAAGKRLWWLMYVNGDIPTYGYVADPVSLPNRLTIQRDSAAPGSSVVVFYGEQ